ncbi:MAG: acyl-CoA thioesterase [Clostridia bacterium]|nr:acyl-CoA thioesterase [Clostridia bacterium]
MFFSETQLIVRYAETDQMGIVHHSHYPVWFEAGRTDFIRKLGLPYSKIEQMGYLLPLIELKCTYKGAARYEDQITVKTMVKELTNTRVAFSYEVYRNSEKDCITYGETYHVWTDRQLKPLNLKKHQPDVFKLLESSLEGRG